MGWERVLEAGSHTRSARGVSGLVPVHLYPGAHTRAASLPVRLRSCVHELLHHHHFQLLHCVNARVILSARSGARAASSHQHILSAEHDIPALLQRTAAHSLRRTICSGGLAAHISTFSAQNKMFWRSCSAHQTFYAQGYHSTPLAKHTCNRHICTWGHFWAMHYPWE